MSDIHFEQLLIVGPGLIGGSLGMALKTKRMARRVIGVGRSSASLDQAVKSGAIDQFTVDLELHAADSDLIVLATSVDMIPLQAAKLLPLMKSNAILTDVGSVKGTICSAIKQAFQSSSGCKGAFVGGHPIAGSEQRGVSAARPDLFDGAVCVLTPTPETDPSGAAVNVLREMWQRLGSKVIELSPQRHDLLLAQSSHLPHLIAASLVNLVSAEAFELTGKGFLDTTRIASGDPGLWTEISLANRRALVESLTKVCQELAGLADILDSTDAESLRTWLTRAKERRDQKINGAG